MVVEIVGFEGEIVQDSSKPDGTPVKRTDISLIDLQVGAKNKASRDYSDKLISDILEINRFALAHKKDIIFFTPVTNNKFLKSMDFDYFRPFLEKLLSGGIEQIKLLYFVAGLSELRNEKDEPMTFLDPDHLNAFYVKQWLQVLECDSCLFFQFFNFRSVHKT